MSDGYERVKDYLEITNTDYDPLLSQLVDTAWAWIDRRTGRTLAQATCADYSNGDDSTVFVPQDYPLVSVASVVVDDETIPQALTALDSGWLVVGNTVRLRGYRFTRGVGNVLVTYTAGYAVMPDDLTQAMVELVAHWFNSRKRPDITSASMAGTTVSYTPYSAPANVLSTVQAYARVM